MTQYQEGLLLGIILGINIGSGLSVYFRGLK